MTSRQLPETGEDGVSNWVWVDALPSGETVARYHSEPDPWWEDKYTGKRLAVKRVKLWARLE